jgi:hypothetical protein
MQDEGASDAVLAPDLTAAVFPDDLGILDKGDSGGTSDQSILSVRTLLRCDHTCYGGAYLTAPKALSQ